MDASDALLGGAKKNARVTLFTSVMLPLRNLRILRFHRVPLTLSSLPRSRLSLAVRPNSTRVPPVSAFSSAPSVTASDNQAAISIDKPKLSLTFTCTAGTCTTRSTHQFTKRAYEKGIVLIECPGCKIRYVSLAQAAVTYHKSSAPLTNTQAPHSRQSRMVQRVDRRWQIAQRGGYPPCPRGSCPSWAVES
jgi:hypothetical protein